MIIYAYLERTSVVTRRNISVLASLVTTMEQSVIGGSGIHFPNLKSHSCIGWYPSQSSQTQCGHLASLLPQMTFESSINILYNKRISIGFQMLSITIKSHSYHQISIVASSCTDSSFNRVVASSTIYVTLYLSVSYGLLWAFVPYWSSWSSWSTIWSTGAAVTWPTIFIRSRRVLLNRAREKWKNDKYWNFFKHYFTCVPSMILSRLKLPYLLTYLLCEYLQHIRFIP